MTGRLAEDPELAAAYQRAHEAYLAERDAIEPLGTDVSAGGHARPGQVPARAVAHALAAGPGVNPFGDEALDELGEWWAAAGPCVTTEAVTRATRRLGPAVLDPGSVPAVRHGRRARKREATNAAATSSGACRSSSAALQAQRQQLGQPPRPARLAAAQLGAQLRARRGRTGWSAPAAASSSASTAATASGSRVIARSTSSAVTLPEPSQIELSGASR